MKLESAGTSLVSHMHIHLQRINVSGILEGVFIGHGETGHYP